MNAFFEQPILNSPYEPPAQHWELDGDGQPTNKRIATRRAVDFVSPIPQPKKRGRTQRQMVFDKAAEDLGTASQQYDLTPIINGLRLEVEAWRNLPDPNQWRDWRRQVESYLKEAFGASPKAQAEMGR